MWFARSALFVCTLGTRAREIRFHAAEPGRCDSAMKAAWFLLERIASARAKFQDNYFQGDMPLTLEQAQSLAAFSGRAQIFRLALRRASRARLDHCLAAGAWTVVTRWGADTLLATSSPANTSMQESTHPTNAAKSSLGSATTGKGRIRNFICFPLIIWEGNVSPIT